MICNVLRSCEGITSIISLLQNQYLNERIGVDGRVSRTASFTDRPNSAISPVSLFSPTSSHAISPTQPSHAISPTQPSHSTSRVTPSPNTRSFSSQRLADSGVRKVVLYLTGVLMNISRMDAASCVEIGQLGGVEVLVQMIGVSREKQIVYCLECLRACCKHDESCKVEVWGRYDPIDKNGDMWRHHPSYQLPAVVKQPSGSLCAEHGVRGSEQPSSKHPHVLPCQWSRCANADRRELAKQMRLCRCKGAEQPALQ